MIENPELLRADFLSNVLQETCWLWTGRRNTSGYGVLNAKGRAFLAHRLAYILFCGEIPPGKLVCHRCDNRACVNPGHLFLGTAGDNARDRDKKHRANTPRGERNAQHKLTTADVERIRAALDMSNGQLARDFGVSRSTIADIRHGKTWKHLPQPQPAHRQTTPEPARAPAQTEDSGAEHSSPPPCLRGEKEV